MAALFRYPYSMTSLTTLVPLGKCFGEYVYTKQTDETDKQTAQLPNDTNSQRQTQNKYQSSSKTYVGSNELTLTEL